jgi:hypothetical protein
MRAIEQNAELDDPQRAMQRQRQLIARLKELELRLTGKPDETKSRTLRLSGESRNTSASSAVGTKVHRPHLIRQSAMRYQWLPRWNSR